MSNGNESGVHIARMFSKQFSPIITFDPNYVSYDTHVQPVGSSSVMELGRGSKSTLNSTSNDSQVFIPNPDEVFIRNMDFQKEINLGIQISQDGKTFISAQALLDSGANVIFIDRKWVVAQGLKQKPLRRPIPVYNVDGTKNSAGEITHYVDVIIRYEGHQEQAMAEVTDLGKNQLILGYTWLKKHNPTIDWTSGKVMMNRCPRSCSKEESSFVRRCQKEEEEAAYIAHSAWQINEVTKDEKTAEQLVPKEYHQYLKVFQKKDSERMPIRKPWDHAIDLKEGFKPKKGRIIPLSVQEQEEVSSFIDDQLKKGYIRPSKSEQTSPVFFVPKKDG